MLLKDLKYNAAWAAGPSTRHPYGAVIHMAKVLKPALTAALERSGYKNVHGYEFESG